MLYCGRSAEKRRMEPSSQRQANKHPIYDLKCKSAWNICLVYFMNLNWYVQCQLDNFFICLYCHNLTFILFITSLWTTKKRISGSWQLSEYLQRHSVIRRLLCTFYNPNLTFIHCKDTTKIQRGKNIQELWPAMCCRSSACFSTTAL